MADAASIYGIFGEGGFHYIGMSTNVEARIAVHLSSGSRAGVWMKDNDHDVLILESAPDDPSARERFWIVQGRAAGHPLLNRNKFALNFAPAKRKVSKARYCPVNKDRRFDAIQRQCAKLRITEGELLVEAGVSGGRYRNARLKRTGNDARMAVLSELRTALEEAKRRRKNEHG